MGSPVFAQVLQDPAPAVSTSTTSAQGTKRSALVIGNAAYRHVQALQNPEHDAQAMATKLRSLGYQVQFVHDMDRLGMNEAVSTFLSGVEPGSDTLIYYSGHGVELNGSNYLLPTDIPALSPDSDRLLRTEAINLTDLLMDVQERKARVTLVILDACRDNPFRVAGGEGRYRSLGSPKGGLASVNPPRGTFVLFAAGVGEQALDNLGNGDVNPNGLFTRKLLELMDEPGLEIRQLTYKLRSEVSEAALETSDHHSQMPSYYDQMLGDFYFKPRESTPSSTTNTILPAPPHIQTISLPSPMVAPSEVLPPSAPVKDKPPHLIVPPEFAQPGPELYKPHPPHRRNAHRLLAVGVSAPPAVRNFPTIRKQVKASDDPHHSKTIIAVARRAHVGNSCISISGWGSTFCQ